jgi:hypothetical protein
MGTEVKIWNLEFRIWGRVKGAKARKPIIKDRLVTVIASTPFLRIFFDKTAVAAPLIIEAKTNKFPSSPPKLAPFLKMGSIIIIKVPVRAIKSPILSLFVTRSLRNKTPAIAMVMGDIAEIKFESIELVLFIPKNKSPSPTEVKIKPYNKTKIIVFLSFGSLIPENIKKKIAIIAEIKKRYVRNTAGENPPKVYLIIGVAIPQIKETIRSSI